MDNRNSSTEATSTTELNYDAIFGAIEGIKAIGPIFTMMSVPKAEYDALIAQAGKTTDRNPIGIRISVNPLLPAHMICAYDSEGNLWIMDLREPTKMHNMGKTSNLLPEWNIPSTGFFRP